MSVIRIKPRNDLLDTDQFTGTPHNPQEILVIELSTISSFFSGVLILFPPGVAVLRIKSTWLRNPLW
jgi:hypothetical protein